MQVDVTLPDLGSEVSEVLVTQWLKNEGDQVKEGDAILVVETEKTSYEVTAPTFGKLAKILAQAGETVKTGGKLAVLDVEDRLTK